MFGGGQAVKQLDIVSDNLVILAVWQVSGLSVLYWPLTGCFAKIRGYCSRPYQNSRPAINPDCVSRSPWPSGRPVERFLIPDVYTLLLACQISALPSRVSNSRTLKSFIPVHRILLCFLSARWLDDGRL
jgi:hypothetical protein